MTEAQKPVADWEAIERDYRAGIKTLRQIAGEHGLSHVAVNKRAKKEGWTRDLAEKIKAKADELVTKSEVTKAVTKESAISEREVIESNAQAIANVRLSHRKDIARGRNLVTTLFEQLEVQVVDRELFEELGELLRREDDKGQDKLNDLYHKIIALPSNVDSAKKLAEALKVLIGMEREAFGMKSVEIESTGGDSIKNLLAAIEGTQLRPK